MYDQFTQAFLVRNNQSRGSQLTLDGKPQSVYCRMDDTLRCGSNGWTLVMKIDGKKVAKLIIIVIIIIVIIMNSNNKDTKL